MLADERPPGAGEEDFVLERDVPREFGEEGHAQAEAEASARTLLERLHHGPPAPRPAASEPESFTLPAWRARPGRTELELDAAFFARYLLARPKSAMVAEKMSALGFSRFEIAAAFHNAFEQPDEQAPNAGSAS